MLHWPKSNRYDMWTYSKANTKNCTNHDSCHPAVRECAHRNTIALQQTWFVAWTPWKLFRCSIQGFRSASAFHNKDMRGLTGPWAYLYQLNTLSRQILSKWGIDPERDICSLGVMVQGSGQMGELSARRRRRRRRRRHLEIGVWNSSSFRPWIGLIWEISPRKQDHSAWNFDARLFWKNPKNQEKSDFQYFQDRLNLKNTFSNISRILENVADSNFQYFQAGNN